MTNNELEKAIRKQRVPALFVRADKDGLLYGTVIRQPENPELSMTLTFRIPFVDIGDGKFEQRIESQLLIRWLQNQEP